MNKVILVGVVGSLPIISTDPEGRRTYKFSVGTDRKYTDKYGHRVVETSWHRVVFERPEEKINIVKGDQVAVSGWINYRTYLTEDGKKKFTMEVEAEEVKVIE